MRQISYPYICDECGMEMREENGPMVEWLNHNGSISDVRIVHATMHSPKGECYKHTHNAHRRDLHIQDVVGDTELLKELGLKLKEQQMLVITRKSSEGITLNTSDGEIYIGFSTGNPNIPIKVAIEAPQAVTVLRDELVNREIK